MKLIGLTGGIGAGKSTVSAYLKEKGYPILDADQTAKDLLRPGTETFDELVSAFGPDILFPDGSLDRNYLAKIAFSEPKKKAELDRITHTKVIEVILNEAAKFPDDSIVFIDAPAVFRGGDGSVRSGILGSGRRRRDAYRACDEARHAHQRGYKKKDPKPDGSPGTIEKSGLCAG